MCTSIFWPCPLFAWQLGLIKLDTMHLLFNALYYQVQSITYFFFQTNSTPSYHLMEHILECQYWTTPHRQALLLQIRAIYSPASPTSLNWTNWKWGIHVFDTNCINYSRYYMYTRQKRHLFHHRIYYLFRLPLHPRHNITELYNQRHQLLSIVKFIGGLTHYLNSKKCLIHSKRHYI